MNKIQIINGMATKVVKDTIERISKDYGNNLTAPLRGLMSSSLALSLGKAMTRDIYRTAFVVNTIVIDIEGTPSDYTVFGYVYRSIGGNSPYARELVRVGGGYDKIGEKLPISEYDKNEGCVVPKYSVTCGDTDAKTLYVDAECLATLDFSVLNKTIQKMIKGNKTAQKNLKREVINKVLSYGIVIENGSVRLGATEDKTVYNIISWSPSNERSETALLTSIELPIAEDIINRISGNAIYSAVRRKRSVKDLVKFSKRIGIFGAPATETATFGNDKFGCVIYNGQIKGPEDYDDENRKKLVDAKIIIDRNTYDGSYVISAELVQAMYKAKGRNITLAQALLLALQTRASVLASKVFGEAKTKANMKFRLQRLIKIVGDESKILRITPGQDVTGINKDDYELIIIGNEDNIGVIMDENGAKALGDITIKELAQGNFMNYVLDVAKASKTAVSGQMLQKFININKEAALDAYLALMHKQYNTRMDKAIEGDINPIQCSLAQYILRYVDNFSRSGLEDLIKTELAQTEAQIKKFNVSIDALYLRALFDDAYFLTDGKINGVLGRNPYTGRLEAYSYDVELMFKDQIAEIYADDAIVNKDEALANLLTGVAIKYPSPSADENALFTFLTAEQITDRIAAMQNLSIKEKRILMDDFVNTSFGVIKMAPNNTIKHRLAGMDTDYDGVAVVFEKSLVDIIRNHYVDNDGFTVKKGL